MPRAYIGVGSNIDREANIRGGLHALRDRFGELTASKIYASAAVGFEGEDFYNLVVSLDTELSPAALVDELRQIEFAYGRKRNVPRFSSRTLDLDLLLYDDLIVDNEKFVIPREDIIKYAFVLRPLAEIAGDERHPQNGERYADLWDGFDQSNEQLREVTIDT